MQKIIYFIADHVPTVGEAADITTLNALAAQPYEVTVLNVKHSTGYGEDRPIPCDFVAGTIPEAFSEVDVFDIENPPNPPTLPANQAVVSDDQEIVIGEATYTITVVDGAVTNIVVS